MANTNADLAFMAGSEEDTLYLGPTTDLDSVAGLGSPIPGGLIDVGWLSEDGLTVGQSDSVDKIRGHQNHGVVRTYMSDSSTTLQAALLEAKRQLVVQYLGAKATDGTGVTTLNVPASRKVERLSGVADVFDTSLGTHRRYIFPTLELGERGDLIYKVGELSVYEYNLEVIDGYRLLTNEAGIVPKTP